MPDVRESLQTIGFKNLSGYLDVPVKDPKTLQSLESRAKAFELNGTSLPCALVPDQIFDVGTRDLNRQLFVAVVDSEKSESLLHFASGKLAYTASSENTVACLIVERNFDCTVSMKLRKPCFSSEEAIIFVRIDESGGPSVHLITASGLQSFIFDIPTRGLKARVKAFDSSLVSASETIRGLGDNFIAMKGSQWGLVEYSPAGNVVLRGLHGRPAIFTTASLGGFQATPAVNESLGIGLSAAYSKFHDVGTGAVIPGTKDLGEGGGMSSILM